MSPLSNYDPKTQWKIADKAVVLGVYKACHDMKADHIETLAAFETIIVESGARALDHGDLDSVGPFQQRAGWGTKANRMDPYKSAVAFLDAARAIRKKYSRAGVLAYNVQKCAYAYRNRYSQACAAAKYMRAEGEKLYTQHAAAKVIPTSVNAKTIPTDDTHPVVAAAPKVLTNAATVAARLAAGTPHPRRAAARAWSRKESAHPTRNRFEECLRTVRIALGIPSGADWAIHAWDAADPAYSHTAKIPEAGTPYFFKGAGKFGHIVLVETPGHDIRSTTVWSTDIKRHGKVDLVTIGYIEDHWGMKGLGWTTRLNGVDI